MAPCAGSLGGRPGRRRPHSRCRGDAQADRHASPIVTATPVRWTGADRPAGIRARVSKPRGRPLPLLLVCRAAALRCFAWRGFAHPTTGIPASKSTGGTADRSGCPGDTPRPRTPPGSPTRSASSSPNATSSPTDQTRYRPAGSQQAPRGQALVAVTGPHRRAGRGGPARRLAGRRQARRPAWRAVRGSLEPALARPPLPRRRAPGDPAPPGNRRRGRQAGHSRAGRQAAFQPRVRGSSGRPALPVSPVGATGGVSACADWVGAPRVRRGMARAPRPRLGEAVDPRWAQARSRFDLPPHAGQPAQPHHHHTQRGAGSPGPPLAERLDRVGSDLPAILPRPSCRPSRYWSQQIPG